MEDEERQIEEWNDAIEAIHDDLLFFKRLRGKRRLRGIGNHKPAINLRSSGSQSETPTRRTFLDPDSPDPRSPSESSRQPASRGYSVNAVSSLVPGLVALSMALASVSPSHESSAAEARGELMHIGESSPKADPSVFL